MPINTWSKYAYATLEYLPYSIRNPPQRILHNRVQQVRFLHTNPFDEYTRWAREVSLARNAPRRQLFSVA